MLLSSRTERNRHGELIKHGETRDKTPALTRQRSIGMFRGMRPTRSSSGGRLGAVATVMIIAHKGISLLCSWIGFAGALVATSGQRGAGIAENFLGWRHQATPFSHRGPDRHHQFVRCVASKQGLTPRSGDGTEAAAVRGRARVLGHFGVASDGS